MKLSLQMAVEDSIKCETDLALHEIEMKIRENDLILTRIDGKEVYFNGGFIQSFMILD